MVFFPKNPGGYVACVRLVQFFLQTISPVLNSRLRVETERKLGDFTLEQLVLVARIGNFRFFGNIQAKEKK